VDVWVREAGLERLVVGGDETAAAAFCALLPAQLAELVVGTLSLPFYETEARTLERVRPLAEAVERERESALVDQVVTTALSGGRAALGAADVLGALQEGRVMTLVAAYPVEGEVWQCAGCGLALAQDLGSCPVCGGSPEPRALAGLLPLLASRTDATIELVGGAPAAQLEAGQGLGALLRF
jgi:peptide subunit release factor 1 (eRF1)